MLLTLTSNDAMTEQARHGRRPERRPWGLEHVRVKYAMTNVQQKQYDRFVLAVCLPDLAAQMTERRAWLGTTSMSAETVADIEEYRRERDRAREGDAMREGKLQPGTR